MNANPDRAPLFTGRKRLERYRQQVLQLHQQKHHAAAHRAYVEYLHKMPDDAGMWVNYGVLLRELKKYPASIACYKRALSLQPDHAGVLSNLGNVLKDCDRLDEAVACQQRAVAMVPDDKMLRLNYALALREAKQFGASLVQLNALLDQHPDNPEYVWERAMVNLYIGNFAQGWQDYEARWQLGELRLPDVSYPRWQGEDLDHKTLLLLAEQGYGDTILAARFVPLIKERYPQCDIKFLCKPELHRLFAGLDVQLLNQETTVNVSADFFCPLMSLMGIFNTDDSNVPPPVPLHIPESAKIKFGWLAQHAPGKRKIGIVWSGSLTFKDNSRRAATLEQFLPLAENLQLQLYSFQKGPRQQDLYTHSAVPLVCGLADQLHDFADTAAAVMHMDTIVMTDSSLAHLAASLNKPVINLLQYKPYWIYATDARMRAWYPAMQSIRQRCPGDWESVFNVAFRFLLVN